ncbi:hypothetical protein CGJ72_23755, partial [Vibrio parahaemolyticus]
VIVPWRTNSLFSMQNKEKRNGDLTHDSSKRLIFSLGIFRKVPINKLVPNLPSLSDFYVPIF